MGAATQAHLFGPVFTTKPVGAGTGLGLSTVYGIVQHAGGTLDVESSPNRGATFTILLPADAVRMLPNAEARAMEATLPTTGVTVLRVEDETAVRQATRRLLERSGHTVMEARHGADALLLWRESAARIDAVITDVRMPELGGRELLALRRRDAPMLPVVVISGYAEQDVIVQRPYEAFVEKPFSGSTLLAALQQVLNASRQPG